MAHTATMTVHPDFRIGTVDRRMFSGFIEHLGRSVYGGMYEPTHPSADEEGFRTDVLAEVRELDMPLMRFPGGNFVSGYVWEDGVGPRESRPRRLDLAFRKIETNEFGTNEFVSWCAKAATAPMLAVNLGSRGIEAARDLVEYCNHPGGTYWSDLRRSHGYERPHGVRTWCLGNEMDGPWQIGAKPAAEYGRLAAEAAKVMKWVDPSIELTVVGSALPTMPTYPEWDRTVLDMSYDYVDYLSIHYYTGDLGGDVAHYLASPLELDRYLQTMASLCDVAQASKRSTKQLHLSLDEWNVYHGWEELEESKRRGWEVNAPVPPIEDEYTLADALVLGGMLVVMLRHADRLKIACLSEFINYLGPVMSTEAGCWRQSNFYPFLHASKYARGVALDVPVIAPTFVDATWGTGPRVDAVATWDEETGDLVVFAVNRDMESAIEVQADLRGFAGVEHVETIVLAGDDLGAVNSSTRPDVILPRTGARPVIDNGVLTTTLPASSWNVVRMKARR